MKKFWEILTYEYKRHVLRRRFLFGLLSIPIIVLIMALVVFLLVRSNFNYQPVGYVDLSGILANPVTSPPPSLPDRPIQMLPFNSETQARQALLDKKIQAYFIVEANYPQTHQARAVAIKDLSSSARNQFSSFLRANLLAGKPQVVVQRLISGDQLTVRSLDGSRQMGEHDWFNIFVPFFAGIAFMTAMFTTSGYLMQAVVEEKENRTMEVLVTSVSPLQLMSGKIIGLIGVGLSQLAVWIGIALLAVWIARNTFKWMNVIHFAPGSLALLAATLLPAFVMVAALMAAVGATVTEAREGQQITGLFTLPIILPYWFAAQIMSNPNGPLAVGLSLFPLTAPITLTMRLGFATIPPWQFAVSIGLLVLSAIGAVWLAGRAFHLGMLQYGRRLTLRQLLSKTEKGMR